MKKIITLLGPTASGKSAFGVDLALYLKQNNINVTIINADSRQLYADFPIITAQPSKEERQDIPHVLYSILQSHEKSNAGLWLKNAQKKIEKCEQIQSVPIFIGGTGMYIKALTEGIAQIPQIPKEVSLEYLTKLNSLGIENLYNELLQKDPLYAQKIHKNDKQRILRALEVFYVTHKPLSTWHKESQRESPYTSLKIGIGMPLTELEAYLYKRTEIMLEQGAIEEARRAFEKCPNLKAPAWTGIGCKELGLYLTKEISLETACELWNKNTRAYAKRQWTWFRADKKIFWCHPLDKEERTRKYAQVLEFLQEN